MRASLMDHFRYSLTALLLALALALSGAVPAAAQQRATNISADLVAEVAPAPGQVLNVALVFRPSEGWHGYWSNPGDAGLGMTLDWHLPTGWTAGEPQYPVPQQLLLSGLMNHVYEGEYAVLVPITVPAGAAMTGWAPITLDAQWLACTDQICVPESAALTLRVPQVQGEAHPFDAYRAALPPLIDQPAHYAISGDTLRLAIPIPASMDVASPHVFVAQDRVSADRRVAYARPQRFLRNGDMLVAEVPLAELLLPPGSDLSGFADAPEISGILAYGAKGNGISFAASTGAVPQGGELLAGAQADAAAPLWSLILAALAGGLILNLMPCVFPILSLKAMTLARAGESEAGARREAAAYSAGVVLACMALGALLLVLRAGGQQIGWAFQLQEPIVVVSLLVLAVLLTANFAGLFELPALSVSGSGGRSSAFATGLLAAFVATPCSGPFMAAALGAALLLPAAQALLLFAMLGLGLALPFLLLGFVPALRSRLPRPGPWMDRFRKAMALPMGLTALALVWLVARLGGKEFALFALVMIAGFLLGLAIVGRLQRAGKMAWPAFAMVAAPFAIMGAFALPASFERPAAGSDESLLSPVPYTEVGLAEARATGKPVFVWFTADWCVTCKVNESVAIEREATAKAFEAAGVVTMRGDWTVRDEAITRFLTDHGVAGVPLYMWYPASGGEGQQLPQVLTPSMLVDLAEGAAAS